MSFGEDEGIIKSAVEGCESGGGGGGDEGVEDVGSFEEGGKEGDRAEGCRLGRGVRNTWR